MRSLERRSVSISRFSAPVCGLTSKIDRLVVARQPERVVRRRRRRFPRRPSSRWTCRRTASVVIVRSRCERAGSTCSGRAARAGSVGPDDAGRRASAGAHPARLTEARRVSGPLPRQTTIDSTAPRLTAAHPRPTSSVRRRLRTSCRRGRRAPPRGEPLDRMRLPRGPSSKACPTALDWGGERTRPTLFIRWLS